MTKQGRHLPKDVIEHWPEVFGEVKINVMPLRYLHTVLINFKDGKTWEIKVTPKTKSQGWPSFERHLSQLCRDYEERIQDVDFKLDTDRIRKDMEKLTQRFLKKKKL
jgi:hypothetical protein